MSHEAGYGYGAYTWDKWSGETAVPFWRRIEQKASASSLEENTEISGTLLAIKATFYVSFTADD